MLGQYAPLVPGCFHCRALCTLNSIAAVTETAGRCSCTYFGA